MSLKHENNISLEAGHPSFIILITLLRWFPTCNTAMFSSWKQAFSYSFHIIFVLELYLCTKYICGMWETCALVWPDGFYFKYIVFDQDCIKTSWYLVRAFPFLKRPALFIMSSNTKLSRCIALQFLTCLFKLDKIKLSYLISSLTLNGPEPMYPTKKPRPVNK